METKNDAESILESITEVLTEYLDELKESKNRDIGFVQGEIVAYVDVLEQIQNWEKAKEHGLNFNLYEYYVDLKEKEFIE